MDIFSHIFPSQMDGYPIIQLWGKSRRKSRRSLRNILSVVQDFYPEMIHQAEIFFGVLAKSSESSEAPKIQLVLTLWWTNIANEIGHRNSGFSP